MEITIYVVSIVVATTLYRKAVQRQPKMTSTTVGTVLKSYTVTEHRTEGMGVSYDAYKAKIKYEYEVLGKEYVNEEEIPFEVKLGNTLMTSAIATRSLYKAERLIDQFPVGTRLTIKYDPAKPEFSTYMLEGNRPGGNSDPLFWYNIGLIFFYLGGCLILVLFLRGM